MRQIRRCVSHPTRGALVVLLVAILVRPVQGQNSNSCLMDNGISSYPAGTMGSATPQGTRLYWVGGFKIPNEHARNALRAATEMWNAALAGTGIEIRYTDTGGNINPEPTTDSSVAMGAARYNENTNAMPFLEDLYNASHEGLRGLFAHELGHFLGIDENNWDTNSIMKQCAGPTAVQCAEQFAGRTVGQGEAEKVRDCLATHSDPMYIDDYGYADDPYEDTTQQDPEDHICYSVDLIVTTWYCAGGYCSAVWSDRYQLHHWCEPLEDGN
jgi:hypothetical protein